MSEEMKKWVREIEEKVEKWMSENEEDVVEETEWDRSEREWYEGGELAFESGREN